MTQSFGDRLKKYRQDRRLTQQELADQVGVSNKTVSRWESEGGYPDVPVLVPLARALGVTVDDLLDGEKPVRTMGKADWQSILSFAFALGGGVLFFLFDLFMPGVLCYLAYLGCMAYGVYLQKYYTFHSKWFFVGNCVMDLAVNLALMAKLLPALLMGTWMTMGGMPNVDPFAGMLDQRKNAIPGGILILVLLAVLATALTQYFIRRWYGGEDLPKLTLVRARWEWRNLFLPVIPVLTTLFWAVYGGNKPFPQWAYVHQKHFFLGLLAALALLGVLLFFRKGRRGRLALALTICVCGLLQGQWAELRRAYSVNRHDVYLWGPGMDPAMYLQFRELAVPQIVLGLLLLVAALLGCFFCLAPKKEKEEETET